jgi:hypothetical protein
MVQGKSQDVSSWSKWLEAVSKMIELGAKLAQDLLESQCLACWHVEAILLFSWSHLGAILTASLGHFVAVRTAHHSYFQFQRNAFDVRCGTINLLPALLAYSDPAMHSKSFQVDLSPPLTLTMHRYVSFSFVSLHGLGLSQNNNLVANCIINCFLL